MPFKPQEVLSVFSSPKLQALHFTFWIVLLLTPENKFLKDLFLGVCFNFEGCHLLSLLKWLMIFSVMTQESSAFGKKTVWIPALIKLNILKSEMDIYFE